MNEDSAERIISALDAYLNMRELVASSTEGWFTSEDVYEARVKLVESLSVTRVSTPAERLQAARAAKKERK